MSVAESQVGTATDRFRQAEDAFFKSLSLKASTSYLDLEEPRLRVRVVEVGEGPPVILLPGLGAVAAAWAPLLARLEGFRLIAVDRPGCGLSDSFEFRGSDLRGFSVRLVSSVVRALGLERVSVIGNSIGGTAMLWFASAFPERVDRVVLLGAPPFVLDAEAPLSMRLMSLSFIARRALADSGPAAVERVFTGMGHPKGILTTEFRDLVVASRQLPGYAEGFLGLLQSATGLLGRRDAVAASELSTISCPTLLIWGPNDTHGPVVTGERMVATMPNCRLERVGSGHLPWLDDPATCAHLTHDFLAGDRPTRI